jgi:hypothetical protein
MVITNNASITVKAFESGYNSSVAVNAIYIIRPQVFFTSSGSFTNQQFVLSLSGLAGKTYVLQATTNLVDWTSISTNVAGSDLFNLTDSDAAGMPYRFYRAVEQP